MEVHHEIKPGLLKKSALALGFFDGVHPGHQVVISRAVNEAARLGARPAVVTFREHPRALTLGESPPLLTTLEQRLEMFSFLGMKTALVLSFTEELCRLDPEDYVATVLVDCLGSRSVSVGFNHRFGRNRVGTPEVLAQLGTVFGFVVHVADEVVIAGRPVSSSAIREALLAGDVELARQLLSRPYEVRGTVVAGEGRGRQIGYPTANVDSDPELVMPAHGVYAGRLRISGQLHDAIINLGVRPTFEGSRPVTEVHVFDYLGDLYGRTVGIEFWKYLRSEQKFDRVDDLKAQIAEDCRVARCFLKDHPSPTFEQRLFA